MPQPSWVRWRIFALFFSVGFTAYLLRTNMSIAGPSIMKDFGMTEFQLGIVLGAFAWGTLCSKSREVFWASESDSGGRWRCFSSCGSMDAVDCVGATSGIDFFGF